MKIINNEESLVALIVKESTQWISEKLDRMQNIIQMFMPDRFEEVDSSVKGYTFDSIRFDLYNRYAEKVFILHIFVLQIFTWLQQIIVWQGNRAPVDIHPNFLYREGAAKVNHTQRIPHVSETIKNQPEEYEALVASLKDICDFICSILKKHLPQEYTIMSVLLDQLPLGDRPATYPFGGFVLNIQVCTDGHKDEFDDTICLVIPFGDYEGGDLVLWERGLVLDLKQGHLIFFPSSRITHFNLHFTGFRGSIVMHTDKELKSWENRNGWSNHVANSS